MMKYIEAEKAEIILEHILETDTRTFSNRGDGLTDKVYSSVSKGLKTLKSLPAADVIEVRHGKWKGKPIAGYSTVKCSVCGVAYTENSGKWLYCPNCGAKMDSNENG